VRRGETTSAPRTGLVPVDSAHSVHIDPPPGFGCFTSHSVGAVARRARSARLDVAVWPGAATWTFRAIDFEGRPIAGAAASVALDEHSVTSRSETSGDDGVLRVRDIPSIPFLRRMDVRVGTSQSCGSVYGLSLDDGPPEAPIDVVFTNGGRYRGPGADVRGCPAPSGVDRRRMAPLTVRVLDRDGAPAAAVDVVCSGEDRRTTDADGCVRFPALPIGPARFVAGAYGFLPTAAAAEIGRDETLEIAETGPRRVRVIVTDAQGRVLPSAEVGIESEYVDGPDGGRARFCCDIVQIEDGVQILSPLTDSSGSVDVDAARGRMCFSVRLGGARATVSSEDDVVCVTLGGD
jgi:hypothetical protein